MNRPSTTEGSLVSVELGSLDERTAKSLRSASYSPRGLLTVAAIVTHLSGAPHKGAGATLSRHI